MAARRQTAAPIPPMPDRASLHDAAIRHLARYATTQAGLLRVLHRRIERWARASGADAEAAAGPRGLAAGIVADLARAGLVNDTEFAAARARSLARAGRSRRAIAAHLAQRGVDAPTLDASLPDDPEAELAAALLLARKRRLGPFAPAAMDAPARLRALGILARAGFSQDIARRALAMDPDGAEQRVNRLRRE
jgi:regulatory protein